MDINQEILNRIAEALERISPNIDEKLIYLNPMGLYMMIV